MSFYVYELIDPTNSEVFYVGKGCNDRMYAHAKEAKSGKSGAKCERIRRIFDLGEEVNYKIISHFHDEDEAFECEIKQIAFYGLDNLTNQTPGGEGRSRRAIEIDPIEAAREIVRVGHKSIHHAITRHKAKIAAYVGGLDMIKVAHDMAMDLKDKVGEEYFNKYVWGV